MLIKEAYLYGLLSEVQSLFCEGMQMIGQACVSVHTQLTIDI
jgi:hypothetical protein